MSAAYLQRLFDRAAAASPPQPDPTSASLSPIAEADQRLNDPALAGLFGFGLAPDLVESAEGAEAPPVVAPSPLPRPPTRPRPIRKVLRLRPGRAPLLINARASATCRASQPADSPSTPRSTSLAFFRTISRRPNAMAKKPRFDRRKLVQPTLPLHLRQARQFRKSSPRLLRPSARGAPNRRMRRSPLPSR
jgi:hypothetical protein